MSSQLANSAQRILLLYKRHFRESRGILYIVIFIFTGFGLAAFFTGGNIWRLATHPLAASLLSLFGVFWGTRVFKAMRIHGPRLQYLALPASASEKMIAAFLAAASMYLISILFPLTVTAGVAVVLNHLFWGYAGALFNPFSQDVVNFLGEGLYFVLLGMCGALWLSKHPVIGCILIILPFFGLCYGSMFALFDTTPFKAYIFETDFFHNVICEGNAFFQFLVGNSSGSLVDILWSCPIIIALYFRLKESEA